MIAKNQSYIEFGLFEKIVAFLMIIFCTTCMYGCAHSMAYFTGPGVTDEDRGRRTIGMVIEDSSIETKISGNLYKLDQRFRDRPITVVSHNGLVLLTGSVADDGMLGSAHSIAGKMRGVKNVINELKVGPEPNFSTSVGDAWIQSKIKIFMYSTRGFPASRIKVTTLNGTVYLMGLVSEQEAIDAVEIIKNISGIRHIIKIFEITPV